jgi:hypothetical protein
MVLAAALHNNQAYTKRLLTCVLLGGAKDVCGLAISGKGRGSLCGGDCCNEKVKTLSKEGASDSALVMILLDSLGFLVSVREEE